MSVSFCSSGLGDEDREAQARCHEAVSTKGPACAMARRVHTPDPSFADCPAHLSPPGELVTMQILLLWVWVGPESLRV